MWIKLQRNRILVELTKKTSHPTIQDKCLRQNGKLNAKYLQQCFCVNNFTDVTFFLSTALNKTRYGNGPHPAYPALLQERKQLKFGERGSQVPLIRLCACGSLFSSTDCLLYPFFCQYKRISILLGDDSKCALTSLTEYKQLMEHLKQNASLSF